MRSSCSSKAAMPEGSPPWWQRPSLDSTSSRAEAAKGTSVASATLRSCASSRSVSAARLRASVAVECLARLYAALTRFNQRWDAASTVRRSALPRLEAIGNSYAIMLLQRPNHIATCARPMQRVRAATTPTRSEVHSPSTALHQSTSLWRSRALGVTWRRYRGNNGMPFGRRRTGSERSGGRLRDFSHEFAHELPSNTLHILRVWVLRSPDALRILGACLPRIESFIAIGVLRLRTSMSASASCDFLESGKHICCILRMHHNQHGTKHNTTTACQIAQPRSPRIIPHARTPMTLSCERAGVDECNKTARVDRLLDADWKAISPIHLHTQRPLS